MQHILYIEVEREIGEWVERDLTSRGYRVTWLRAFGWDEPRDTRRHVAGAGRVYRRAADQTARP